MLHLSRYVLLKLSGTTSPQKLFSSDCFTLYKERRNLPNVAGITSPSYWVPSEKAGRTRFYAHDRSLQSMKTLKIEKLRETHCSVYHIRSLPCKSEQNKILLTFTEHIRAYTPVIYSSNIWRTPLFLLGKPQFFFF